MVLCGRNRQDMKYTAECVNARDAINRMEVREKRARHAELEALSERKRQAVRQTQEAAEESRRRQLEAQRLREVAEYLGVSDDLAPNGTGLAQDSLPRFEIDQDAAGGEPDIEGVLPDSEGAGAAEFSETDNAVQGDLNSIREELRRRQEKSQ